MLVLRDWLKEYCGEGIPTLTDIENLLTFHSFEIEETKVVGEHELIDVKVLPDRASDCLSHLGVARELAALTEKPLVHDPLAGVKVLTPLSDKLSVTIESVASCRRFALAYMSGVQVGASPLWLRARLEALGQRSINNVVDATNYVMFSLGQPLHAYDAEKFSHNEKGWHVGVRMAREGESVTTLGGNIHTLTPTVQLIVDGHTDTPVGIAGIKGGVSAEIDEHTHHIILEAANFDPQITRKASQFLKLQTDASKRFENNLSPELVPYALIEVVTLIRDIAGGVCEGYRDEYVAPQKTSSVHVTLGDVNDLLGTHMSEHTVENILTRLNFLYTKEDGGWMVRASWERMDIHIKEDVIAEVGRVYGYEHVVSVMPHTVPLIEYNARHFYSERLRHLLIEEGFSEVITSSFKKNDIIELQNSLAQDKRYLRSTLLQNIHEVLDRNMPNVDLLALRDIRAFEIGTVFQKTEDGTEITEHTALTFGVRTKQQGHTPKDDVLVVEVLKKIENAFGYELPGIMEQGVYECNLTRIIKTLPVPTSYEACVPRDSIFVPYSSYPFISRDIALWAPEATASSNVAACIRTHGGELLTRVTLFDEFKKEGRVSYAFRLIFQSHKKTLTDEEVGERMICISEALTAAMWEIR